MINLKTEIIYFKCNNDFEFEFNLNTALQIRLFTECPANGKALLGALSLAVSRSRAIIITSKFDEELIIKLAGAIGFTTETIDPDEYGISKMDTDKLITGGVPLVTSDGVYAGMILESGPQSLIIITNERAIRKKLMNELVHGYLNNIAVTDVNSKPIVANNTNNDYTRESTTDEVTETVTEDVTVDTNNDDSIVEAADNIIIESFDEEIEEIPSKTIDESMEDNSIVDDDITEESIIFDFENDIEPTDKTPSPKKKGAIDIFTAILAVILFLLVAFIVYSLIIDPFLNNISIEENFKHIWGFLFE